MSSLQVEGYNIHYEQAGSGPPVILIHGHSSSWRCWRETILALSPHFTVYAIDLLGFGDSDKPGYDYTIENFARLVKGFIEAAGITRASLVGHSMGGTTAICMAIRYPDLVGSVVLVGSPVSRLWPLPLRMMTLPLIFDIPYSVLPRRFIKFGLKRAAVASADGSIEQFLEEWAEDSIKAAREMSRKSMRDLGRIDYTGSLGEIRAPALIVFGDRERLVPLIQAETLNRGIPNSKLVIIEGTGHGVMFEKPEEYNRVVLEFLREG